MADLDLRAAFSALDRRLAALSEHLEVIVVGGAVLQMEGIRATEDVDAFYRSTAAVEKAIRDVERELGYGRKEEAWLNGSVANLNPSPPSGMCPVVFSGTALTVRAAPLDYVALMKLASGREKDVSDVAAIVKTLGVTDPGRITDRAREYGFAEPDEPLVTEAFWRAYGDEWLVEHLSIGHGDAS